MTWNWCRRLALCVNLENVSRESVLPFFIELEWKLVIVYLLQVTLYSHWCSYPAVWMRPLVAGLTQ